jgi:hypothetical protein
MQHYAHDEVLYGVYGSIAVCVGLLQSFVAQPGFADAHEHSGTPTKSRLLVRATMSAIVLIAGIATHSIETVERVDDLKARNREPTVSLTGLLFAKG